MRTSSGSRTRARYAFENRSSKATEIRRVCLKPKSSDTRRQKDFGFKPSIFSRQLSSTRTESLMGRADAPGAALTQGATSRRDNNLLLLVKDNVNKPHRIKAAVAVITNPAMR